jgi:hypothetical protein
MLKRTQTHVRNQWMGALALFLVLAGGGAYAAFDPVGGDGDIDACFAKKSGDLDLLKGRKCGKGEKPVAWSEAGPKGDPGAPGAQGPQGDPGPTIGTFADSGSAAIALTGTDKMVTSTAGHPPGANGAVGGPVELPGGGRYTEITSVQVKTSGGPGAFDCGLQVSSNGGPFFEQDRAAGNSPGTLRFTDPGGTFNSPAARQLQFQVVCKGTGTVDDAELSTIIAYRES